MLSWSNYVALGDSLTAGRDDHEPGGARIGWAQRLVALARQRMQAASDVIREQAAARGALCLDAWSMPAAADPDLFGKDRIHPNASGHQLMATLCADLLLAS